VFGYSNSAELFADRSRRHCSTIADPIAGLAVEGFGLPDNLMIEGAVTYGGGLALTLPPDGISRAFNALDIFEICTKAAAKHLNANAA
jgi:hypothetical protein